MNRTGSPLGMFTGGCFLLAGCIIFYFVVISQLVELTQMQFWQSTQAQLLDARVDSSQSYDDNNRLKTTYRPKIKYQYYVGNNSYTGKRYHIPDISSGDTDLAIELTSKISREQNRNGHIIIWYNPDKVSESIYSRSLNIRTALAMGMFSCTFIMVGAGAIYFLRPNGEIIRRPANADNDKPWTTVEKWASPVIYSNAKSNVKLAKYIAIVATLFFGTFFVGLFGRGVLSSIFGTLILLVPFFVIKRAMRIQKEWQSFGKVPLTLTSYPGVIGGKVKGDIVIPVPLSHQDTYKVVLKCTKHRIKRTAGETKYRKTDVWSKRATLKPSRKENESLIQLEFDIPAELPQSSRPSDRYHEWSIEITGNLKGVNFERTYEVPVFVTEESLTAEEEIVEKPLSSKEMKTLEKRILSESDIDNVNDKTIPNALKFHLPGLKTAIQLTIFGVVFGVIGLLVINNANLIIGTVFTCMGGFFFLVSIWSFGRNCKVEVKPNEIEAKVFFFSTPIRTHKFCNTRLKEVSSYLSSSGHSSDGKSITKYGLSLVTNNGKVIKLGGEFDSKRAITHMKQQIEQVFWQS